MMELIMMAYLNYACLFMLQSVVIGLLDFPLREGDGMISPSDLSLLNLVSAMRSPLEGKDGQPVRYQIALYGPSDKKCKRTHLQFTLLVNTFFEWANFNASVPGHMSRVISKNGVNKLLRLLTIWEFEYNKTSSFSYTSKGPPVQ